MTQLKTHLDGGSNMKLEIKCVKCDEVTTTTNKVEGLKAFYNPCEDCGSKQEVKWIEAPSKGNK